MNILNIAFYKFTRLPELHEMGPLRAELKNETVSRELKGKIILAPEGINCFLAGLEPNVRGFLTYLSSRPEFQNLDVKESWSENRPFKRMLVKLKSEIITMGRPDIRPTEFTAPYIRPLELKEWLDNRKEVVLLDTRNRYEIEEGTFEGAIDLGIKHFRTFPDKLMEKLTDPETQRAIGEKPVVMFCTGGIRCEKATAFAMKNGMKNVFQIEGGILKYFEEAGSAHYKGKCFVFDERVVVDEELKPSPGLEYVRKS